MSEKWWTSCHFATCIALRGKSAAQSRARASLAGREHMGTAQRAENGDEPGSLDPPLTVAQTNNKVSCTATKQPNRMPQAQQHALED